ncbi:MAG TPA: Pr6Pr family membrane protein [Flavobacterium sp.]|jgi:hypothetical protein|uniref:Pr6Pr family membrane protein n=1 Tax=Flavobacterium sp. TaxID=239 RepID=UPI002D1047D9|nr:Pr6Pr family membrane protein [Flavobacterium sp.]HPW97377.1 Pr6Pr family membrane protein [Flavobacterium sp.]HQA74154.1 Pr6Pr family membrane protein [Flavobacterium sp.]
MKKVASISIGILALITVAIQFYLMIENRVASITETVIRFFSFFTILTNLFVGIYFTLLFINIKKSIIPFINKPGNLSSITVYITIVGLVYQFALRNVWEPKGLQKLVDELLHSIIPLLVILFWYFYENKSAIMYKSVLLWLIYPLVYLFYILGRGFFSGFYPYPFVNVAEIGLTKVMTNSIILLVLFTVISTLFIKIGHKLTK